MIIIISFICSLITVSIGLTIGALMKTMEGFSLIMSFVTQAMFLFSNALFDIKSTSKIIKLISIINPLTYYVDLLRKITIDYNTFSPLTSLSLIILWISTTATITIKAFEKMDVQR